MHINGKGYQLFFFCPVPPEEHLKPFKSNPVTVSTAHYRHSSGSLLRAGLPSSVGGKGEDEDDEEE